MNTQEWLEENKIFTVIPHDSAEEFRRCSVSGLLDNCLKVELVFQEGHEKVRTNYLYIGKNIVSNIINGEF